MNYETKTQNLFIFPTFFEAIFFLFLLKIKTNTTIITIANTKNTVFVISLQRIIIKFKRHCFINNMYIETCAPAQIMQFFVPLKNVFQKVCKFKY